MIEAAAAVLLWSVSVAFGLWGVRMAARYNARRWPEGEADTRGRLGARLAASGAVRRAAP